MLSNCKQQAFQASKNLRPEDKIKHWEMHQLMMQRNRKLKALWTLSLGDHDSIASGTCRQMWGGCVCEDVQESTS
jgi:hypothetical protein